jgi:hypothetical protein
MPDEPKSRWSLGKEILGTAVAILPFALAGAVWMSRVETRVAVLEHDSERAVIIQKATDDRQDAAASELLRRIDARLAGIETALRVPNGGGERRGP